MEQFDFIIIGAGSAGAVLAHDLADNGKNRILLLENGPSDRHPLVKIPLGYGVLYNDKTRNYRLSTAPEPHLNQRIQYVPRGNVVGGSGSINAMVYCRGMASDFDSWAALGLTGWDAQSVTPIFESLESYHDNHSGIRVNNPISLRHKFCSNFVKSAAELGLDDDADFNSDAPEGCGFYRVTTRKGIRHSAASAFLSPALSLGCVKLVHRAQVQKIVVNDARAEAVIYRHKGQVHRAKANGAIVLAAGAIHSPQILQLSGIGDADLLTSIGVTPLLHNPNVGEGLQDHMGVSYLYKTSHPTLNKDLYSIYAKIWQGIRYLLTRQGPLANSVNQYGGFLRSHPGLEAPDQQLYFNPATYTIARAKGKMNVQPDPFEGFTLSFQPTRPTSRGYVRAQSSDISQPPEILTNALATKKDRDDVIAGGKLMAKFVRTEAIQSVISEPITPCPSRMQDHEILSDFRARAGTIFHPCGSLAMGLSPDDSVVAQNLKLHQLDGLYIADASVFPSITSGNINAPTMMVARMGARGILKQLKD